MLNNEPSIYKYKDRWRGQLVLGYDDFGKKIRKSTIGKTKREVRDKLIEIEKDYFNTNTPQEDYTVLDWLEFWLETYKKPSLEESSYLAYERILRNHLYDTIGRYKLSEITTLDIQIEYNKMFNDKEKYSKRTILTIHSKLSAAFKKAVASEIISKNPCIGVELPKGRNQKKVSALSKENQNKLVKRCEQEEYSNIFIFLIATGLRIGEALGLTWDRVNLDKKEIQISKTMIEIKGNPSFKEYPKTDAGIRTLPLNNKACEILEERLKDNSELNYLNLVFFSRTYNFRTTANLRRYFDRVCEEAGIEKYNLHGLRHTYATRMIENNCNIKALSNMLGHKNISTTLDIYSDALIQYKKELVSEINIF